MQRLYPPIVVLQSPTKIKAGKGFSTLLPPKHYLKCEDFTNFQRGLGEALNVQGNGGLYDPNITVGDHRIIER